MEKKHFSEEQIAFVLRQAESGTTVAEIIRKLGISEQTFYRWKKRFAGLGIAELRRLRILEEQNKKAQAAGRRSEPGQEDAAGRALKKTLRPAVQRVLVREVQVAYRVAERRACRVQFGYRRLWVLLRREGWLVNRSAGSDSGCWSESITIAVRAWPSRSVSD